MEDMLSQMRQYLTPGAPDPAGQALAVEFYYPTLDHCFLSANPEGHGPAQTIMCAASR